VLAVVSGDRRVTLSQFRNEWDRLQPPQRPDSLTPQGRREFLDLLIGKEALGHQALAQVQVWTNEESVTFAGMRDRMMMQVALDSALHEVQTRLLAGRDTVTDSQVLGIAARETLVARLGVTWNEPALAAAARAFAALPRPSSDSSVFVQLRTLGQLPQLTESERRATLASGPRGSFTGQDLLDSWARLSPLERPRISSADQVRDLVKNGLFERELRAQAEQRHLERRPEIVAALANQREYYAVQHLVAREVYAKIDTSSAALRRYYDRTVNDWALPTRVGITRLVLGDRRSASAMAVRLANAAEAESLVARAARSGINYHFEVAAEADSQWFARAMRTGTGGVMGPDSVEGGWEVARVNEVLPPRPRSFEEVRRFVAHGWYAEEGERLMVELMDHARKRTSVIVNERALAALRPW
jgi:hypothetical protein